MTILRIGPARIAGCVAAACVVLVLASSANAAVFCVKDPACPAGGFALDTPEEAFQAADADWVEDTIRIGAGSYGTSGFSTQKPVDVVGAGLDKTNFTDTDGGPVLSLENADSSVTGLTVVPSAAGAMGVRLMSGADATDVSVVTPDQITGVFGFVVLGSGSELQGVEVDLPDSNSLGVYASENAWVRDARITASTGVEGAVSVRRAVIRAKIGIFERGFSANAANVLITRHPQPTSNEFTGIWVRNLNGTDPQVAVSNLTIDGGGTGAAIDVRAGQYANTTSGTAGVSVKGAILRGVAEAIRREGATAPVTANVDISYSSYDGSKVVSSGDGSFTQDTGNLKNDPDPRFVDPAHLDYRLRHDSPLIDVGRPTPALAEEDPDLAGNERVRDSDGNGSPIRDIGAYEYQRLAPAAAAFTAPAQLVAGQTASFEVSPAVDPDGDEVSYGWAFGDGATASGQNATHAFGTAGSFPVTLTVTDPTGLSSTATHPAEVAPAPQQSQESQPAAAPPFISLAAPRCAVRRGKRSCTLRGTVQNAPGVRVTVARRGATPKTLSATVRGGRWSVRIRTLRRGTTKFTARALASDGRTAKTSRRVKLR